ncbi:MAG: hypothetical protein P8O16_00895 [Algoriphagus sp.]|uniref:hypothetical protein n=1 Tax=Algoriphagus sp. TaxID=1872435 RepID=UPI0026253CBB|nr:hypothetical protein [Algoriphagus sp.]MDG1275803.1 hypothetical protein [Algoriphagus sp.]
MIPIAQFIVILFGAFIFSVGILMLFNPEKALAILRKAGSTNLINYGEITIRLIPAIALVIYAPQSRFPDILKLFGGFMIATSLVLYFVPRRYHHAYLVKWAAILSPFQVRLIAPLAFLFGVAVIYAVL